MTEDRLTEQVAHEWWTYRYRKEAGDIELSYVALRRWTRLTLELWAQHRGRTDRQPTT